MAAQTRGEIDIVPPLTWTEVQPSGFMVMPSRLPRAADGRMAALSYIEELVPHPEGTLHRFTFGSIIPVISAIEDVDRETFRLQVQEIVNAFPTHTFGGVSRLIRFRGDQIDDQWRVGLAADGVTVRRQTATLTWVDV